MSAHVVQNRTQTRPSILRQPKAVWAVAFSCVIAFMGIGLVDPILPAISHSLDASPSQTMLLFTSYLIITGAAMFFTSFVSSRLGPSAPADRAGADRDLRRLGRCVGFGRGDHRPAGRMGPGQRLVHLHRASHHRRRRERWGRQRDHPVRGALGLGIAVGPLVGGALGGISWRGPFFGTAVLMTIGLVSLLILLPDSADRPAPVPLSATFRALGDPTLRSLALAALFYNFGFFTLLAYSPFPLETAAHAAGIAEFGAHQLGAVFCSWGLALALTSVFAAPRLTRAFGRTTVLYAMLGALVIMEVAMAVFVHSLVILVVCIIVAGLFLGVMNTVLTEAVMEATTLPRSVASSTYSGVRFLGGAIAPAVAGLIAAQLGGGAPYWFGAGALLVSGGIVVANRVRLTTIDHEPVDLEAEAIGATT